MINRVEKLNPSQKLHSVATSPVISRKRSGLFNHNIPIQSFSVIIFAGCNILCDETTLAVAKNSERAYKDLNCRPLHHNRPNNGRAAEIPAGVCQYTKGVISVGIGMFPPESVSRNCATLDVEVIGAAVPAYEIRCIKPSP